MSKMSTPSLSDRDKSSQPGGWGHRFHHTIPQRRVRCVLGDMLAPRSADDIPPITPEAMASVQAGLRLLVNLVGDRDHGRFLGASDAGLEECRKKAEDILLVAHGLTGILRVVEEPATSTVASAPEAVPSTPSTPSTAAPSTPYDASHIDLPSRAPATPPDPSRIRLQVDLSAAEVAALNEAHDHVRKTMAHTYAWAIRDTSMTALGKVLAVAREVQRAQGGKR